MSMQKGLVVRDSGGKIAGTQGLTEKQAAYVAAFVANGGFAGAAAAKAGYEFPEQESWRLGTLPHVRAAIAAEVERRIAGEAAAAGVGVLLAVARDTGAPASARVAAGRGLLDAAGLLNRDRQKQSGQDSKPLSQMSISELEAFIAGGLKEVEAREAARTVDGHAIAVEADSAQNGT